MRFPRNAKIFRGQLDMAPFAGMFFLLVIFMLLASLVYTPGVRIRLPASPGETTGIDGPILTAAMDAGGQIYFENQLIAAYDLRSRLREEVKRSPQPLTLVIQADRLVTFDTMWRSLGLLARDAGITNLAYEMLPAPFSAQRAMTDHERRGP